MIPLTTKPGAEIVALCDIDMGTPPDFVAKHSLRSIVKGERFHLGGWLDGYDCPGCNRKTITLAEIDPRLYASTSIIIGMAGYCPSMFDIPIKLPHSLRRFECEELEDVEPILEDA